MVWIIEDDDCIYKTMCDGFESVGIKTKLLRYKTVPEALHSPRGKPDIILIDQTAIGGYGGSMGMGCTELFYANLGYLVEKHLYSVFGIYSAIASYAQELVEEIQARFDDAVIELVAYDTSDKERFGGLTATEFVMKHLAKVKDDQ